MIVVLDLNGVLVDVRRYEDPPIRHRAADIVLPNRQRAYMHPLMVKFLEWLSNTSVPVVLFTSRTSSNAAPIERALQQLCPDFKPVAMLHQEECDEQDGWRPVKSSHKVLEKLKDNPHLNHFDDPSLRFPRAQDLVFVDDHPERVHLEGASFVAVKRYDALNTDRSEAEVNLTRAMWDLYELFRKKIGV